MDEHEFLQEKLKELGCDENGLTPEAKLNMLANALSFQVTQSDTMGFDNLEIKIAGTLLGKIYQAQKVIKGTIVNPFEWTAGIWLIPTGYYMYEDKKYLYIGLLKKADEDDHPTGNTVQDIFKGWRNGEIT